MRAKITKQELKMAKPEEKRQKRALKQQNSS